MPLKAQNGLVRIHSASVVDNLDERSSGIGHHHFDIRGAGIHRVLHQLFDNRRGSLDHLSGRYHIGYIFRKDLQFHYNISKNLAI